MIRFEPALSVAATLCLSSAALSEESVSYRLSYATSGSERVRVALYVPALPPGPQILVMPRAIPMGYGEQPFDRYVGSVRAVSPEGHSLAVVREEGPRWKLGGEDSAVARIEYEVDVVRMEKEIPSAADTSKVRPGYLGLLGYSVFAYIEGVEDRPVRLSVDVPEDWPVLTTLAPRAPPAHGRTEAEARDFYALADSQIVAGPDISVVELPAQVPLFLVLYAEGNVDAPLLGRLAVQAMEAVVAYFGEAPFSHYTVHQELLRPISERHEYGFSMEHLDSATFYLGQDRGVTSDSDSREIARTRYNFAHHFAHAWIPKRAYSSGFYPFTWELAPVLDTIWFSEGFPQYAAIEALADGLPEEEGRLHRESMIAQRFRASLDESPPFIRRMSAIEISRVASTRYSEDFRTGRSAFSRGGLMAAEMDALIREMTGGKKRLRDALRRLMAWSRENRRPFEIEELPRIFEQATGVDTRQVLERWLQPLAK